MLNSDNIEDYDQGSRKNATVEGEQLSESIIGPESNSISEYLSKSISSYPTLLKSTSSELRQTLTDASSDEIQSHGTNLGGASENLSSSNREAMNDGGESISRNQLAPARKWNKDHTPDLTIGNPESKVQTRRATQNECLYMNFLSQNEPKKVEEALHDADQVTAMHEELNEFERNKVWKLVPVPKDRSIVGTK